MVARQILEGIRHGYSGYTNHGCGCDICRAAFREYKQDYRQRQREKRDGTVEEIKQPEEDEIAPPPDPGTWVDDADPPNYEDEELPEEPKAAKKEQTPTRNIYEGPTLLGVRKDLVTRNVYESAPGIAAVAERLAALIDNPLAIPQAPAAAARLLDIYKEIGVSIKSRGGKLATVKQMITDPDPGDERQEAS